MSYNPFGDESTKTTLRSTNNPFGDTTSTATNPFAEIGTTKTNPFEDVVAPRPSTPQRTQPITSTHNPLRSSAPVPSKSISSRSVALASIADPDEDMNNSPRKDLKLQIEKDPSPQNSKTSFTKNAVAFQTSAKMVPSRYDPVNIQDIVPGTTD